MSEIKPPARVIDQARFIARNGSAMHGLPYLKGILDKEREIIQEHISRYRSIQNDIKDIQKDQQEAITWLKSIGEYESEEIQLTNNPSPITK